MRDHHVPTGPHRDRDLTEHLQAFGQTLQAYSSESIRPPQYRVGGDRSAIPLHGDSPNGRRRLYYAVAVAAALAIAVGGFLTVGRLGRSNDVAPAESVTPRPLEADENSGFDPGFSLPSTPEPTPILAADGTPLGSVRYAPTALPAALEPGSPVLTVLSLLQFEPENDPGEEHLLLSAVLELLMDSDALPGSLEERARLVGEGGLIITTTIDPRAQATAAEAVAQHVATESNPVAEVRALSVDSSTGAVLAAALYRATPPDIDLLITLDLGETATLALLDSKDGEEPLAFLRQASRQVFEFTDVMVAATSQLLLAADLFDDGHIPADHVDGESCVFTNPSGAPDPYQLRPQVGRSTLQQILRSSQPCGLVRLYLANGGEAGNALMAKYLPPPPFPDIYSLPLTGLEAPFSVSLDVAATMANGGLAVDSHYVQQVSDHQGSVVYHTDTSTDPQDPPLIEPNAAALVSSTYQIPGDYQSARITSQDESQRNAASLSYSAYLTTGVYTSGYFDAETAVPQGAMIDAAVSLGEQIMADLHRGLPDEPLYTSPTLPPDVGRSPLRAPQELPWCDGASPTDGRLTVVNDAEGNAVCVS